MKKKILLSLSLVAGLAIQAQPQLTTVWTDKLTLPRETAQAASPDFTVIDKDGNVYVSGVFQTEFEFGNTVLEGISGGNTYLLKIDAANQKQWAVAFRGASEPTAITADPEGNIYVAGRFEGNVTFNSTDGQTITQEGLPSRNAAYIAKYNPAGVLQKVETFVPTEFSPELGEFDWTLFEPRFRIRQLAFANGTLYASAISAGVLEKNGYNFTGSYFYNAGFGAYIDSEGATIFTMTPDLTVNGILVKMIEKDNQTIGYDVTEARFALTDDRLYIGLIATGEQNLTTGGNTTSISFPVDEEGNTKQTFFMAALNSTGTIETSAQYSSSEFLAYALHYSIAGIIPVDGKLLVGGTYQNNLPFRTDIVSTDDDLYAVALNPADLSVTNAVSYGSSQNVQAIAAAMTGNTLIVSSNVEQLYYNADNGETNRGSSTDILTTGLETSGDKIAWIQADTIDIQNPQLIISLLKNENYSAIHSVTDGTGIHAYPNPVIDRLNFTEPCDVIVYNSNGAAVKSGSDVRTLEVGDLPQGIYHARIETEKGAATFTFVKK